MKKLLSIYVFINISILTAQVELTEHILHSEFYLPLSPECVATADIDSDGDMDVIAGALYETGLFWYENFDGKGDFSRPKGISSFDTRDIATADMDGDGDIDIITCSRFSNSIQWYENTDGKGTFRLQRVTREVDDPRAVHAADVDGDGDMDIISAIYDQHRIVWYQNLDGAGTFGEQIFLSSIPNAEDVNTADFDNDGDLDVVSISFLQGKVYISENTDGLGDFARPIEIWEGTYPHNVEVGDIDNDGDIDIVSSGYSWNFHWLKNDGNGNFEVQIYTFSEENSAASYSIYLDDVDGDDDLDFVTGFYNNDTIAWYENADGDGNLGPKTIISTNADGAIFVHASDLTGDNRPEVLSVSDFDEKIVWYENLNGLGSFSSENLLIDGKGGFIGKYPIDIDKDGDFDLLGNYSGGKLGYLENLGGQNDYSLPRPIYDGIYSIAQPHDLDDDGDKDLVLYSRNSSENIKIFEKIDGEVQYNLVETLSIEGSGYVNGIQIADFNNDRLPDLLVRHTAQGRIFYQNLSNLDYSAGNSLPIYELKTGLEDIDSDGDLDIVTRSDNLLSWYENLNGTAFSNEAKSISDTVLGLTDIVFGDLNADGYLDIFVASRNENKIFWYKGLDGTGNFSDQLIISSELKKPDFIELYDIDYDGDLDLLAVNDEYPFNDKFVYFENLDGQGNFSGARVLTKFKNMLRYLDSIDYDGDGKEDIFTVFDNQYRIAWYENNGLKSNKIVGRVLYDESVTGCTNIARPISDVMISAIGINNEVSSFTLSNGFYSMIAENDEYAVSIVENSLPSYFDVSPNNYNLELSENESAQKIDFCVSPNGNYSNVEINMIPILPARPGFNAKYALVYKNIGTIVSSGSITVEFDSSKIDYLSSDHDIISQTENSLTFSYTDIQPFDSSQILIDFTIKPPPIANNDEIIVYTTFITPDIADVEETNNSFTFDQILVGSFDPNDILVLEGEQILLDDSDDFLHYIIRFENIGSYWATNIYINNPIDDKLDLKTLQIIDSSHDMETLILNDRTMTFTFNNIELSFVKPYSQGYIAYKIKPLPNVEIGDIFYNDAEIKFDFNNPIATNTVSTEIMTTLGTVDVNKKELIIYPNPTKDMLNIKYDGQISDVLIYNALGQEFKIVIHSNQINLKTLNPGIYFLILKKDDSEETFKFIKL